MKTYLVLSLSIAMIIATKTEAQSIENSINLYGNNFPQEKIHIHFDKEVYLPGETIWFKAYIFEENLPSERSTNFYAALYNENGTLIQDQISPILNSTSDGHFDIPDSLNSKQLICRAYTSWMLNFDTTLLFTRGIKLINRNAKEEDPNVARSVSVQFFPEGGNIIEGTRNTIAFKANYNTGLPFEINGLIKKQETGEVLTPIRSMHNGMGRFDIDVHPGEKYYAEWTDNKGSTQKTYLPPAKPDGVSLKLVQQKDRLIFNLVNSLPKDSLHVLMYMYQKVFYKANVSVSPTLPYTGSVPTNTLPTGVMQLTVFDSDWKPVAERIAFINNNNYTLGTTSTHKTISTQKRGKNIIEIEVADTIPANMSLSVTDAELNSEATGSTIVSNLLLGGDVKGYIHDPAYYFTGNANEELKDKLDLVMLTHGWRRYNWSNMQVHKTPAIYYPSDNYLAAYGQVSKDVMAKLPKDESVTLIVKTKDSTNNFYSIWPDSVGLLKQPGLIFYDTARLFFSFNKNKLWNKQMAFSRSNYTLQQPYTIYNYGDNLAGGTAGTTNSQTAPLFNYYNSNKDNQSVGAEKTLQGVVVKSGGTRNWKNDPIFKLDQKYTSGLFSGGANVVSIDVLHDETAAAQFDIYNYLSAKVPGISVVNRGGDKRLVSTRGVQSRELPVLLFIEERLVENVDFGYLNLDDIAYIKVVQYYAGERNEAGLYGPAISVYRKKGEDLIDRRPKDTDLKFVEMPGYTAIKEFYSPDYSKSNTTTGIDARTTLLWLPYILTDKANRKVPISFYNNDFTKKMRIVLEGINDEGKMIRIEKIIE